ncbi:MAG: class I SAM-dependent methyltransferase [Bacteriovoracaceae bacterium]|nr:class I SAM-dependent methyltransferase [Bacteriovoracaceae bacterium]
MDIKGILEKSIDWRYCQCENPEVQAMRLVSGVSDGLEGVLVEQYGSFVLATIYNLDLIQYQHEILKALDELLPTKAILIKARERANSNDYQYLNNDRYDRDAIHSCSEGVSKFEIHTDPRHDYGLYLDTKSARDFVHDRAAGKNILNLFSYTCAFGVSAMTGGASFVTNIDPCKEYLEWGRRNAELNSVVFKRYPDTTQGYLSRHLRRLEKGTDSPYDLTIVDPPAFLVGRGSKRLARNMWPEWMDYLNRAGCPEFIIVINDKSFGREHDLEKFFRNGLGDSIKVNAVEQSFDVVGQQVSYAEDKCYFNPMIFHICR